jgi:diketogulonate reductase-like aldo/keto reductase
MLNINLIFSCTHIRISSKNPALDVIGDYLLDPTIIANGRPVYISTAIDEDTEPKKIYHFSNEEIEETEEQPEEETEEEKQFHGRWIIGENVYSQHGWAFIPSWSIDPSDKTMNSFVSTSRYIHDDLNDEQVNLLTQKLTWQAYYEDEWGLVTADDDFQVQCLSKYTQYHSNWDWLFVTTKSIFSHEATISNINHRTTHGFYYRIDHDIWRKVESDLFLMRETSFFKTYNLTSHLDKTLTTAEKQNVTQMQNETLNNHININHSLLQQLLELFDITTNNLDDIMVYSIFEYNEYTNEEGLPLTEFVNKSPLRLTTMFVNNGKNIQSMASLSNSKWHLLDMDTLLSSDSVNISTMILDSSRIDMTLLHVDDGDEETAIYDVFRNYYKQIKLDSFTNTISSTVESTVLSNNEIKDKLINTANNNDNFPYLMAGLGTGGISGYDENREILTSSISRGYRKFDSAAAYHSEEPLGDMLIENKNVTRDELFITTKLWPTEHGYYETYHSVLKSLDNLKTNYIDLYLIHWPDCFDEFEWMDCSDATRKDYVETWEMMQKLYAEGVLLNIGVSNFDFDQFNRLILSANTQILPHVVQNYFDIVNQDWEFVEYLNNLGVVFEGYATYRGIAESEERKESEPHYLEWFQHLTDIANSKNTVSNATHVSPSQVLLRWLVESQISVIPRTRSTTHLNENWNFWNFQLTQDDVDLIHTRIAETNGFKDDL